MRLTHAQHALLVATCASLVGWGVVIGAELEVEIGEAKIPSFSAIQGIIPERLGEQVLDGAKQQVDTRFATERAVFGGDLTKIVSSDASPSELMADSQVRADRYADELVNQQRAALTTKFIQKGYTEMLEKHTEQLGAVTEIQSKVNEVQGKINQFKQLYVQVKFLMGR